MVRFSNKNIVAATSSDDIDFYTSDKQRPDILGGTQRWRENLLEAVMNYTTTVALFFFLLSLLSSSSFLFASN